MAAEALFRVLVSVAVHGQLDALISPQRHRGHRGQGFFPGRETEIIQVCADISKEETQRREIRAALQAAAEFRLKNALVITADFSGEIMEQGVEICFLPIWQWLIVGRI